jgi:Ca2+-binding RTX toxin-like protein
VNLQTQVASGLLSFAHIQQVIGSGSAADTLTGPNLTNTWSISSLGGGKIFNSNGTFTFSAIENLTGGSGTDVFDFSTAAGAVSGTIDGQGGGNWLEYLGYTVGVTVNLATGTATGASGGINNIQNVIGGAGDDTITGNALGNILVGGAGNDVINGGSGRSLLIGGGGADTVTGGSADDIVIGGTTNYDLNTAALQSILNEWQRTDKSYADRITDLRNGTGLNGSNKLIFGTTVHDDGAANVLTGGLGMDWFFMGAVDVITDLMPGEQVN